MGTMNLDDRDRISFQQYLAAKKEIDSQSINHVAWKELQKAFTKTTPNPHVLEIGSGIGTMFERLIEWELFQNSHYHAIDHSTSNNETGVRRLRLWGKTHEFNVTVLEDGVLEFTKENHLHQLRMECVDLFDFLERGSEKSYDLIIAHAFLDLVDLSATLPKLFALIKPGGSFYFPLNFDGVTIFEPALDLDAQIMHLYHRTMDERMHNGRPSGISKTGRLLFSAITRSGGITLASGSSDWVIFPRDGYSDDERIFLKYILGTVHNALLGHPELDEEAFENWIQLRMDQIETNELVYIAHQLDFMGTVA
jgi:spermidine synthase